MRHNADSLSWIKVVVLHVHLVWLIVTLQTKDQGLGRQKCKKDNSARQCVSKDQIGFVGESTWTGTKDQAMGFGPLEFGQRFGFICCALLWGQSHVQKFRLLSRQTDA